MGLDPQERLLAENPLGLGPANWPANHTDLGVLPWEDATWQDFATATGEPGTSL